MTVQDNLIIRIARAEDNEQLIALAQACPQNGSLQMYTDRYPDFFAMNRIQSKHSRIFVAENADGKIIASVSLAEKEERYQGRDIKVLHICDIRTHPEHRRTKAAAEFITLYEKILLDEGYDHGIGEILEGNQAIIKAHKYLENNCHIRSDGKIIFSQLVPALNYRTSKNWTYRKAHADDIPEIVALLNAHYHHVEGFPRMTQEWMVQQLNQHDSFTTNDLWVAVNARGKIEASAGLWDQSPIRRTVATRFSPTIKRVVRVLNALGLIWNLPPVPKEGEALRYSYIRFNVGTNANALGALLRFLMNRIRREGKEQFALIGFHENDPLKVSLRGLVKADDRMHVFSHWPKRESEAPASASSYRYIDLSTI